MQWSSATMYDGRLVAHSSVRDHILGDLLNEESKDEEVGETVSGEPLIFIDTAGALMYEAVEQDVGLTESKYNFGEVDLVIQMIKELIDIGMREADIGVITPYSAQVSEIRK